MIESPHIVETEVQAAAVIHLIMPRHRIGEEMAPAIQEVMTVISEQGQQPVGPLFVHHLKQSESDFDVEVGFPVSMPVAPTGRVKAGALPAAKVARTIYHGDYGGLYAAWDEFGQRLQSDGILAREGMTSAATLWEVYVVGPETSNDPSQWLTELNLPLVSRRAA